MAVTLRPYQEEALAAVMAALRKERFALLEAATGAGKTIMFSELCRRWMTAFPSLRIGILAHRRELVTQARDKMVKVWPESFFKIGLACASLGFAETAAPIIIGSVQTLARRPLKQPINLLIIDEAHRLPPKNIDSQYGELIRRLETAYPNLRVLGVTATPYRLGHGHIYGDQCKRDNQNFFPRLDYQIGLNTLIDQGHLVPVRAKEAVNMEGELKGVAVSGGDYNLGELSGLMSKTVHLESAARALEEHGEGRSHAVVFGVSIDHAELLADIFTAKGHPAAAVHSKMPAKERDLILKRFARGELKAVVNVGVLTEGWDAPLIDLIILCRPTMAPALFVQIVGRGTRLSPGKENLLVLDLSGNFRRHGDPAAPMITWPDGGTGEAPMKPCPECGLFVHLSKMVCPECGHKFPAKTEAEERHELRMRELALRGGPPGSSFIASWTARRYTSRAGADMLRLDLQCRPGGLVHHYLDIEGGHPYALYKTQYWWYNHSGGQNPPRTIGEALKRIGEIHLPERVVISKVKNAGYKKVQGW